MTAEIYIDLPASLDQFPRLSVRQGRTLQRLDFSGFKATGRPKAIAFAPGLSCTRFDVPVAAKSESEARRAALYAVEDDLAQSIEDVHVKLGPKQTGTPARGLYVVDKAILQHWTALLQSAGLGHAEIVPEVSLSIEPGTVYDFGDRLLMHGASGIVTADRSWPEGVLRAILEMENLSAANVTVADPLETLAILEARNPGIRLTEARGQKQGNSIGRWRFAGVLSILAAAVWTAALQFEISSLKATAGQQEAQARAAFRAQFPAAPEPADVHAEVRRLSAATSGNNASSFISLSSAVYEAIAERPGTQLRQLQYTDETGALRAVLRFPAEADAEAFRANLESAGWIAQTESLNLLTSGTEAVLILKAAP